MRLSRPLVALLLALALASPVAATGELGESERIAYRWKLQGFLGAVAGLFMPRGGEGSLSLSTTAPGRIASELFITAKASAGGQFFRYGSEWDVATGRTLRAWQSSFWRGERRSKESKVEAEGVIDIVSAIQVLRRDPPASPRRMEIWSDGRLYPVLVVPVGVETRTISGRRLPVRHFTVRGLTLPERRQWKGQLDLWLADDAVATPVEILVERSSAKVRLEWVPAA
jgi:hypothetical protein